MRKDQVTSSKTRNLESWILAGGGGKAARLLYDFYVIRALRKRELFCPLWYWNENQSGQKSSRFLSALVLE